MLTIGSTCTGAPSPPSCPGLCFGGDTTERGGGVEDVTCDDIDAVARLGVEATPPLRPIPPTDLSFAGGVGGGDLARTFFTLFRCMLGVRDHSETGFALQTSCKTATHSRYMKMYLHYTQPVKNNANEQRRHTILHCIGKKKRVWVVGINITAHKEKLVV